MGYPVVYHVGGVLLAFVVRALAEWMLTEYVESQLLPSLGVVEVL